MQRETGPVAAVYGGILRLVGVVDHTVLAVLYIGVYFHVAVVAEPGVQFALGMGGPQNGTVEHTVVQEAVGQTADVNAASLAVLVGGHLHFLVALNQDLGAFQGVDALLAFAEIHVVVGAVGQDEVVAVLLPVVLVVVQGEAGFLLHAQGGSQLQVTALILVAAGLTHADQAAAAVHKALDG